MKPVRGLFILALLAGFVAAGASAFGLPLMLEKLFPIIFGNGEEASRARVEFQQMLDWVGLTVPEGDFLILFACLLLPTVFIVRGIAGFVNTYLINYCGLKVVEAIRLKAFGRLQQLSLKFHQEHSEGDLLSRILTDANQMQMVMVKVAADLIIQPLTLIFAFGYLVKISIQDQAAFFMLIALLSVPICIFPIHYFGKKLIKRAKVLQKKIGDMTAIVSENLSSQREVRAYNLQQESVDSLGKETSLFLKARMKVVKYNYAMGPAVEIVASVGIAFAIYLGVQNDMTLEKFIPLVTALYFAYDPIKKLGKVHGSVRTGEAALERIEQILHSDDEIKEITSAKVLSDLKGEVELLGVSFAYNELTVLKDISVKIPVGQTVALVGPSGAGKSSFVSLIPRFYDVNEGKVMLDGELVTGLNKHSMREQIAVVSQMPLLFSGTIAENILMGKKGASLEEAKLAASKASAAAFIESLPEGYQTVVGERGEGLSGGQKQRVAIARAFLRDAPILILDEATSALDTESEAQIQQALEELSKGRTTFVIAHRFSSIKHAERILVFNNLGAGGEIIADGSHDELYQSCTLYKELFDHQSKPES